MSGDSFKTRSDFVTLGVLFFKEARYRVLEISTRISYLRSSRDPSDEVDCGECHVRRHETTAFNIGVAKTYIYFLLGEVLAEA